MKNHWKDFHSALYLHKCDYCTDQKLYRDKCKHFSAMFTLQHTSFTMKKVYWNKERFGENRKWQKESKVKNKRHRSKERYWTSCMNPEINLFKIYLRKYVVVFPGSSYRCGIWFSQMHAHPHLLPQHSCQMFIWTHAINPKLSRRQGWAWLWCRRPAPMIICGLVHVRQPTKRSQTATGWLHLWPRPLQISQVPLFRGKYFYNIKLFSWIYIQACWETVLIFKSLYIHTLSIKTEEE